MSIKKASWWIYEGTNKRDKSKLERLPDAPPWRVKRERNDDTYIPSKEEIELVNTALYLRRPLLVTGKPGTGKSSLAHSIAYELGLESVLHWQITTKTTLEDGLYSYDAIGRLQDSSLKQNKALVDETIENPKIGKYIRLGALGTAFASEDMRVLLIDEIDKSDIDLPNNLLHILEENEFIIPELARVEEDKQTVNSYDSKEKIEVNGGKIECNKFPLIIMTSNGEREFPPAFLRRCLHLEIVSPNKTKLRSIVESHLDLSDADKKIVYEVIDDFIKKQEEQDLATDQLLNAIFLILKDKNILNDELLESIWHSLSS